MSHKKSLKSPSKSKIPRYTFPDHHGPFTKVYLVFYYIPSHISTTQLAEGPFTNEPKAYDKMRELLIEGHCAWVVTYND
jgi:hypothetical protein